MIVLHFSHLSDEVVDVTAPVLEDSNFTHLGPRGHQLRDPTIPLTKQYGYPLTQPAKVLD